MKLSTLLLGISFILAGGWLTGCSSTNNKKENEHTEEAAETRWSTEDANKWYEKQAWLVGCNFSPSTAINQLEMWQADSFDTLTINKELGWAADLGFNTVRVYLHDLLYEQDSAGFLNRMDTFLEIADKHHIKPLFVFFDSCWDPFPKLGKQRAPKPHVHNSGWVQSPGSEVLKDSTQYPKLERYVKGVVTHFAQDNRILGWDVWNEPNNPNKSSYGKVELENKDKYVYELLKKTFDWARASQPSQPLTSGLWDGGDWSDSTALTEIQRLQLEASDIISFHNYEDPASFEARIKQLEKYGRPILCTEYMARPNKSTFEGSLPIAKKYNVGAYNWGFVDGKTQTIYAWDSWSKSYDAPPKVWFHDILRKDGTPYSKEEVAFIKSLTKATN
uniref:GH10 domain-containing protein n=1 Tax=Sphingobacterium sp. (strain 21) TaxID=743722 RepID=F4C8Y8_SPHS2